MTLAPPAAPSKARERWIRLGLCATMSLWILAFTPDPHVAGTWPGMIAGLALIERCKRFREVLFWVAVFGAVAIGYGYRWLAPTARAFGEFDARLGAFAAPASWLVLAAYGVAGMVHGILFAALHRATIGPERRPHPLVTVTLFVACETLPIRFLPWMAGYGAVDVPWLRHLAAYGGVPLVSFSLLCLVVPVHELLRRCLARTGARARTRAAIVTCAIGALLLVAGLTPHSSLIGSYNERVRVAIVQGNVGAETKRSSERDGGGARRRAREVYERLTRQAVAKGADLIVWPETAIGEGIAVWDERQGKPLPPTTISVNLRRAGLGWLDEVGRDRAVLLGCYSDEEAPGPSAGPPREAVRYNAGMLREPGGASWSIYRKRRLIPFGETMPGEGVFPGLRDALPQGFRMTRGPWPQPPLAWTSRGIALATFICYEDLLADDVRTIANEGRPDLLVNLTNDSWFGNSWEPWQHLNFARFRAVEHGVPLVRATNTGVSAFVGPEGDVLDTIPVGVEGVIVADLPAHAVSRTFYADNGGYQRWGWWVAALILFVLARRRAKAGTASPPAGSP
jgi:apolipoprotein N-acyltransferase